MEFNTSKCQVIHITRSKNPILHSTLFTIAYWNMYLQQNILVSTSLQNFHVIRTYIAFVKMQTTHLVFLGETSSYNHLNLLPTKFVFVLSYSTAPQFGVHSLIQIYLNLKVSNVELQEWVKHDYGQTYCVTDIMQSLHCRRLDQRRIDNKLSLMYKITHNLIAIPISIKTLSTLSPVVLQADNCYD